MSAESLRPSSVSLAPSDRTSLPNPRFAQLATDAQIARAVDALEANGIHALVAASAAEAKRIVLELLPPGAQVFDSTSKTLTELGLAEEINRPGAYESVRPRLMALAQEGKSQEQRRLGASPDVIVGSVHAVTERGQVVIASASGSQLGPYASGAGTVIWVAGTQKIVPDLETAFDRIREYTFPLENARAQAAYGMGSAIAKLLVVQKEFQPGRITLVLVKENLGF
jgi:L-lactate utilization protein LutC